MTISGPYQLNTPSYTLHMHVTHRIKLIYQTLSEWSRTAFECVAPHHCGTVHLRAHAAAPPFAEAAITVVDTKAKMPEG